MKHRNSLATIIAVTASAFLIAASAVAADGVALGAGSQALGGTALDAVINGRVAAALMSDPGLQGARIVVDTQDGVVHLKGTVAEGRETGRALEIASGVEGVRRVDNFLAVESSQ